MASGKTRVSLNLISRAGPPSRESIGGLQHLADLLDLAVAVFGLHHGRNLHWAAGKRGQRCGGAIADSPFAVRHGPQSWNDSLVVKQRNYTGHRVGARGLAQEGQRPVASLRERGLVVRDSCQANR